MARYLCLSECNERKYTSVHTCRGWNQKYTSQPCHLQKKNRLQKRFKVFYYLAWLHCFDRRWPTLSTDPLIIKEICFGKFYFRLRYLHRWQILTGKIYYPDIRVAPFECSFVQRITLSENIYDLVHGKGCDGRNMHKLKESVNNRDMVALNHSSAGNF